MCVGGCGGCDLYIILSQTHTDSVFNLIALQLSPSDWLCQYYLGTLTGELGDMTTATQLFTQAAALTEEDYS